jgi:hypothetical protein
MRQIESSIHLYFIYLNYMDDQGTIMDRLMKESSGWIDVDQSDATKYLVNQVSS